MKLLSLAPICAGALTCGLLAQGAPPPTYMVPAIREPHHDVKLDNHYVRVLDVTVPPYDSTLFHIHENPYVYVSIGPATLKAQVAGSNDFTDLILKDGEVRYSAAVTHRVGNIAATPFRNITIQIQGRDDTAAKQPESPARGASVVLDNDLVRVQRVVLDPGQSTGAHTHARSHLLVAVHDGSLQIEADAHPTTRVTLASGDFDWHAGPWSHTLTNVGTTRFEAIEVAWK
jgi:quercetin dioxygenase-like cupin family protein